MKPTLKKARLALLLYWIVAREEVRRNKEAGKPKPWTKDPVLQSARFCNVRRMDDKVSRWLLDNWYPNPGRPDESISLAQGLVNAAMARLINWPPSLERLAGMRLNRRWNPKIAEQQMRAIAAEGKLFTGVYIINGIAGQDKVTTVFNQLVDAYAHPNLVDTSSMEVTHRQLQTMLGYGSFISGQIVADLRHVWPGDWADRNSWAPLGPGSRRGIAWLQGWNGTDDLPSLRQDLFMEHMRELAQWLVQQPKFREIRADRRLEMHDIQNCLCEFDKWMRVRTGTGKARNGYPGTA